ncbi:DMT family transporter [Bacillus sp. 7894-2]|uniref:DMT family transporter n=1 Tax=Bacillus sp. 7894-2 TaxID=2021695 RepID=UPI000BA5499F|nr:DMT family transporter [Bacillus sp. 7894-2]PAE23818.1 EamA family transporter [Bacillus sp. 7894-2]
MSNSRRLGLAMIISGASLWGLSGPMLQWFFQETRLSSSDYLVIRLITAGIFTLIFLSCRKVNVFAIWKYPRHWIQLLLFAVLGMLGGQYAFIETIQVSNAVTATLFQFAGPVLITIYVAIESRRWPARIHLLAIVTALSGIFLLITNGSLDQILLSNKALLIGFLTALGFAFYTLQPVSLIKTWGTMTIIGWGMLLGGFFLYLLMPSFSFASMAGALTSGTLSMLVGIIMISTLSFMLYIGSLKYLSPTETSLLSSIEPLVAALISFLWLKETFGNYQLLGGVFIIAGVLFLSMKEKEEEVISLQQKGA